MRSAAAGSIRNPPASVYGTGCVGVRAKRLGFNETTLTLLVQDHSIV